MTTDRQERFEATPMTGNMSTLGFQCLHVHCPHPEDARFWGHDMVTIERDVSRMVCKDCAATLRDGCARCASLATVDEGRPEGRPAPHTAVAEVGVDESMTGPQDDLRDCPGDGGTCANADLLGDGRSLPAHLHGAYVPVAAMQQARAEGEKAAADRAVQIVNDYAEAYGTAAPNIDRVCSHIVRRIREGTS